MTDRPTPRLDPDDVAALRVLLVLVFGVSLVLVGAWLILPPLSLVLGGALAVYLGWRAL